MDAARDSRWLTTRWRPTTRLFAEPLIAWVKPALCLMLAAPTAWAQPEATQPFEILDNSFLVEEAFNQEAGIFQNIVGLNLTNGSEWEMAFTQEWPLGGQTHQLSYTLPFAATRDPRLVGTERGIGDILLHYRYQALVEGPGRPAFSPRLSVILPTGAEDRGLGDGTVGLEVNLPFSKQQGEVYWHGNAGFSLLPGVDGGQSRPTGQAVEHTLFSPFIAGSAVVRARPMLNFMLEAVVRWEQAAELPSTGTRRDAVALLSPGVRGGWNVGDSQLIVGLALPVLVTDADDRLGVFGYLSYELPFQRSRP